MTKIDCPQILVNYSKDSREVQRMVISWKKKKNSGNMKDRILELIKNDMGMVFDDEEEVSESKEDLNIDGEISE